MYYEEADNGEIIGIVPFDIEPASSQYVASTRQLQASRAVDYGMELDHTPSLGQGCSVLATIGVITFFALTYWYIAFPLAVVGIIVHNLRKSSDDK